MSNSVSFRVKSFDNETLQVQGLLEIDLFTPLREPTARVLVAVAGREISLKIPLVEFYKRRLTGRYSVPLKLDLNSHFKSHAETQPRGALKAVASLGRSSTVMEMASRIVNSTERCFPEIDCQRANDQFAQRLIALNATEVSTVWILGFCPLFVTRIQQIIMKVEGPLIFLLIKVKSESMLPKRVIVEAYSRDRRILARSNHPVTPQFIYGRVVEIAVHSIADVDFLQVRVDVRLAKDPKCRLQLPSI
jgi:hypothetical protein